MMTPVRAGPAHPVGARPIEGAGGLCSPQDSGAARTSLDPASIGKAALTLQVCARVRYPSGRSFQYDSR